MNKQHIKEIICRAKRGKKKIMEKLNRAQKCSILGPQNLGSVGAGPPAPPGSAPVNADATFHTNMKTDYLWLKKAGVFRKYKI